jgi:hypothetical protein
MKTIKHKLFFIIIKMVWISVLTKTQFEVYNNVNGLKVICIMFSVD